MKHRRPQFLILTILSLGLAAWWLWHPKTENSKLADIEPSLPSVSSPKPLSPVVNVTLVKPSPDAFAAALTSPEIQTIINSPNTSQKVKDDISANPVAALQRIQAFQNVQNRENNTPINFYGKVMDQYGQPINAVKVDGGVMLYGGFTQSKSETYNTQTDTQGRFSFVGLHGVDFGVNFQKDGYFYDLKISSKRPDDYYTTSPDRPIIYTMWKLQGAEPMVHQSFIPILPCDGTPINVNLSAGKAVSTGGDIMVAFTRNPVQIVRGKPFEWTLTLNVRGGGLVEVHDPYPYEAPADGYQQTITITTGADPKSYMDSAKKTFYYKSADGKYGRMTIDLQADFQPPPTFFGITFYLNPSGSRNLEWDQAKEIKPK